MGKNMSINEETRKPLENERREKLRKEKPLVYEKIMKYEEIIARGECTAIIDFCYDYKCNMKCAHCCNSDFIKKDRVLTINDLKDFTKQADELGLAQFNISGGEPLAFDNLDEIIFALDPARFHIGMSSNGLLLTKKKAKHLKEIGLDKIRISIDSIIEDIHNQTRKQNGVYSKAIAALFFAKEAGLQVGINTIISHQNCRTEATERLAKFANENGFNLDILIARAIGRWEGKEDVLIDREDAKYLVDLRNQYPVVQRDVFPTYNQNRGCGTVKHILHLTKYGDILPCAFIHISLGNIFEEPLKNIINRGLTIKHFNEYNPKCLSGEDRHFIENYMTKFYGKPLPIHWSEVFGKDDFVE
jgi:MoaA/NifB/PqqE/SkfB family radical SAM enzyme